MIQSLEGSCHRRKRNRRGSVILEVALMAPWFFFLMIGAIDWGFLTSALISLESATRTAAVYTSGASNTAADASGACALVLSEMQKLPNVGSGITSCSDSPIVVAATLVTGPDSAWCSQVSVTYTTIGLIPIPGLLGRQFTITRSLTMRIRG